MAPTDRRLNALLLAAHQTLSRAQPGSQQHTLATSTFSVLAPEALLAPSILRALRNVQLNAWLKQTHRVLASNPTHAKATSALHKLRLEACRRTGNLGVQHARAVFPNY